MCMYRYKTSTEARAALQMVCSIPHLFLWGSLDWPWREASSQQGCEPPVSTLQTHFLFFTETFSESKLCTSCLHMRVVTCLAISSELQRITFPGSFLICENISEMSGPWLWINPRPVVVSISKTYLGPCCGASTQPFPGYLAREVRGQTPPWLLCLRSTCWQPGVMSWGPMIPALGRLVRWGAVDHVLQPSSFTYYFDLCFF